MKLLEVMVAGNQYLDDSYSAENDYNTYPSLFLTSALKLNGEGTQSNPYIIYNSSS